MASTLKTWVASNWYSIIALILMTVTFYVSTEKTAWRVVQLETRAAAVEQRTDRLNTAIADLTTTVATTNAILERIERAWDRAGIK